MIITDEADGTRLSIVEGTAPFLMTQVTDDAFAIITKSDITSIDISILNRFTGAYVKSAEALDKNTVWFDTYQTGAFKVSPNAEEESIQYNFGYQTDAADFITTGDETEFIIEVWVVPVSGEDFIAAKFYVSATPSIRPSHEPEE